MAVKTVNSFLSSSNYSVGGKDCDTDPANKDIAWFSAAAKNIDLNESEIESVLRYLDNFIDEMEGRKAEIDAELQLLEAYKTLLKERKIQLIELEKFK